MQLSERQEKIIEIVKQNGPITGENIAQFLDMTRASLRPDLAFLTQIGLLEARPRVGYYYKGEQNAYQIYGKLEEFSVSNYHSEPVVVTEDTPIYNAIVNMFVQDVGTIFVVDNDNCLEGISSRKDMLKIAIGKADINQLPISVIMTRMPNIVVAEEQESLLSAAKKMIEHEIDGLPVVKERSDGRLEVIGRVTKTNITKAFVELGKEE